MLWFFITIGIITFIMFLADYFTDSKFSKFLDRIDSTKRNDFSRSLFDDNRRNYDIKSNLLGFNEVNDMDDIEISDYKFKSNKSLSNKEYKEQEFRKKMKKLNIYVKKIENGQDDFLEEAVSLIKKIDRENFNSEILNKDFFDKKKYVFAVNKMQDFLEYIEKAKKHRILNNDIDERKYLNSALKEIEIENITDEDFKIIKKYRKNIENEKYIYDILKSNLVEENLEVDLCNKLDELDELDEFNNLNDFDLESSKTAHEINLLKKNLSYINESGFDYSNFERVVKVFDKIKNDHNFIKENYNHDKASQSLIKLYEKMKNLNEMISQKNSQFLSIYSGSTNNMEDLLYEFDNLTNLLEAENEVNMI